MIRYIAKLRFVVAVTAALMLAALLATPVQAEPRITVTPTSSYAYDTFVFSGTGFSSGTTLTVAYTDPAGTSAKLTDGYGNNTTVKVGNDGSWELRVQPGNVFKNTSPGNYQLSFCQSYAPSTCWAENIKISNDVPGMGGSGGTGGY